MARVTVQDCVGPGKTNNRFELVTLAAQRAKAIHSGAPITVPVNRDKKTVTALREIAAGTILIDSLREKFLHSLHPQSAMETLDEEIEMVDKDISEEFASTSEDFALTEDQMILDEDMQFEDMDLSEEGEI